MSHKINLPIDEICKRYQSGESEQSIALSFNVSRPVVWRHLKEAGIQRRTIAEVCRNTIANRTPEQHSAYAKAAHDAVRGMKRTDEEKCQRAKTRQERQFNVSANELIIQRWLADRGFEAIPQCAVGPYNIDLAVDHVAIEIFGGAWHGYGKHLEGAAKRRYYLVSQGWSLIIIWIDRRKWPLTPTVVDRIEAFIQQAQHPTIQVINGKGEEYPIGHFYYNKALGLPID